jgi:hypothetical protein
MLPREFARLVIKIVGLAMTVYGVASLPTALGWLFAADVPNRAWTALTAGIAPALIWILIGAGFFYGAGRIVERSFEQPLQATVPSSDSRALEEIAMAVLGLYVLAAGLAEGAYYWARLDLFYRYTFNAGSVNPPGIPQNELGGVAAAITRVVFGILLFLCSRGITALRRRILDTRPMAREDGNGNSEVSARH